MNKRIVTALVALFITTFVFAQVSTTPEVPRNYKPKPKELLPMPDSLTSEQIFPVLGKYGVVNKNGDSTNINITLDEASKGVVWISGLPEGKVKAMLKVSPGTYKIPSQRTFINDEGIEQTVEVNTEVEAAITGNKKPAKKLSGKSVGEGTLIYDKEVNQIYINLGSKFNEADPGLVFAGLRPIESPVEEEVSSDATAAKKKKPTVTGTNYTGAKVIAEPVISE